MNQNPKNNFSQLIALPQGKISLGILGFFYAIALFAPFLTPYRSSDQNLSKTYHPPTAILWKDGALRAQIYQNIDPTAAIYQKIKNESAKIHFFAKGFEYKLFGLIPCSRHLFGVDAEQRIYLLGSDATGRDVFSRLLFGAQISMSIGVIGIAVTMFLGLIIGGLSGYFGGWIDGIAMRFTEFLMAIPGLYLLLALRSAFAQHFSSEKMFLLIVIILSCIGWSGTARVIRGMSLSLRERPFILASEVMGQSPWKILWRHILPNTFSYLIVAATLSIPGYILGEAALSFLGIGIQEPSSSWGLMLAQAQEMKVFMLNFWWLLSPGIAIFIVVIAFNLLGDTLRDIVDPKLRVIK
ncbi:MAG: ABC transporter permease [Verrucomicrobiota bacterium]